MTDGRALPVVLVTILRRMIRSKTRGVGRTRLTFNNTIYVSSKESCSLLGYQWSQTYGIPLFFPADQISCLVKAWWYLMTDKHRSKIAHSAFEASFGQYRDR